MKQYDTLILLEDLNPEIKAAMTGVILEIYNKNEVEAEFVRPNGSNYEYNGQAIFAIHKDQINLSASL